MTNGGTKAFIAAVGAVLLGGGSAFTAGKLSAGPTDARLAVHEELSKEIHASLKREFITQAQETKEAAKKAADESTWARAMLEVWLKKNGIDVPPKPDTARRDGRR